MNRAVILAILLCVAGCQTKYQEPGLTGGVSAAPMGGGVYRIAVRGNGYTDTTTVQDYVFLKAAETALQAGSSYFTIISAQDASRSETNQAPGTIQTSIVGNTAYSTYTPGMTIDVFKPGQDVLIRVGNQPGPGSFRAQDVFDAINPRVVRPQAK